MSRVDRLTDCTTSFPINGIHCLVQILMEIEKVVIVIKRSISLELILRTASSISSHVTSTELDGF